MAKPKIPPSERREWRRWITRASMDSLTRSRYEHLDEYDRAVKRLHFEALERGQNDHVVLTGDMNQEPLRSLIVQERGLEGFDQDQRELVLRGEKPVAHLVVPREYAARLLDLMAPNAGHGDKCRELPLVGKFTVIIFFHGFTTLEIPESSYSTQVFERVKGGDV